MNGTEDGDVIFSAVKPMHNEKGYWDFTELLIKQADIKGNVLNEYGYGGYLIHQLYPESKVFIDGRLDLYGDKFYSIYDNIINARKGWKQLLEEYAIDYILLSNNFPIICHLDIRKDYILVFRDRMNSVYVRNSNKYKNIIDIYGKTSLNTIE